MCLHEVDGLSEVEAKEHDNHDYEYHSALKYIVVQFVFLDLLVRIGVTQPLSFVQHDLIDLLIDSFVVGVIAPHGDAPHDQPKTSSQHCHDYVQDVIRFHLLGRQYKQFFVHAESLSGAS